MEENENKSKIEEELKQEAQETFKQAKEEMKDVNFKEEAEKGKGLIGKLINEPIKTIKEIVQDNTNSFFKTAIVIILLWIALVVVRDILRCITLRYHKFDIINILQLAVAPVIKIVGMAIIIYAFNKKKKISLTQIITAVTVARIPSVIYAAISFLTIMNSKMSYVTSPVSALLSVISNILCFFVVKEIYNEENNEEALKSYIKVSVAYCVLDFAMSFLEIAI